MVFVRDVPYVVDDGLKWQIFVDHNASLSRVIRWKNV